MTTKQIKTTGYNTYDHKSIIESSMSIHQQLTGSCVPQSGTVNSSSKF
jgi:hypothetical protein